MGGLGVIERNPGEAAARAHDLVIVGGGIYGACLALEAAQQGLRPLLLERGDFGGATSWNSLRILHGGLRYLQTLGLTRFRESVSGRQWFCRAFPELVRPQACLMPLYGEGLRRPGFFGAALLANDVLSRRRNLGVHPARHIGNGRVLGAAETVSRFPLVDARGLRGAGLWYDAVMTSPQRVLIEVIRWACSLGATALNYVEVMGLAREGRGVAGVEARDAMDGREYMFASRAVCNCAGPWSGGLAARCGADTPRLFRPSLAFNVLLDREPPSAAAVAVAPRRHGSSGHVYFLYPALGRLLAGTAHVAWGGGRERHEPTDEEMERFLADLNDAIPGLDVRREHVLRTFAGLLPASAEGTARLAVRPIVEDHARNGGPHGLISVSGVKFTTARLVAQRTLRLLASRIGRPEPLRDAGRPPAVQGLDFDDPGHGPLQPAALEAMSRLVREEAVMTLDDLLLRRTNWGIVERDLPALRRRIGDALGWARGREAPLEAPWRM